MWMATDTLTSDGEASATLTDRRRETLA